MKTLLRLGAVLIALGMSTLARASLILITITWSVGKPITLSWTEYGGSGEGIYNVYRSHDGEPYAEVRVNFKGTTTQMPKEIVDNEVECFQIAPVVNGVVGAKTTPDCVRLVDAQQ